MRQFKPNIRDNGLLSAVSSTTLTDDAVRVDVLVRLTISEVVDSIAVSVLDSCLGVHIA